MILALLNQKGGVGKSTISVHIAAGLAKRGRRIMLVDADPQGSALDWSATRSAEPMFPVIGLPRPNLHKEMPSHAGRYEDVVIDGPPRVNELTRSALLAADFALIPVQPSPYDVWAAKEIVDLIREAVVFKEKTEICICERIDTRGDREHAIVIRHEVGRHHPIAGGGDDLRYRPLAAA